MNTTSSLFQRRTANPRQSTRAQKKAAAAKKLAAELAAQQQEQARLEFEAMVRKSLDDRAAQINSWRNQAVAIQKANLPRRYAYKWLSITRAARIVGPFKVPSTPDELRRTISTYALDRTPSGAVAAFLLAAIERSSSRQRGGKRKRGSEEMLAETLHPECTQAVEEEEEEDNNVSSPKRRVRKYSLQTLQRMSEDSLRSYTVGSSPQNGYNFDRNDISFQIDNFATKKHHHPSDGAMIDVFLVTSGAPALHPESRSCQVKYKSGKWYVRKFDKLTTPVREAIGLTSSDNDNHNEFSYPSKPSDTNTRVPSARNKPEVVYTGPTPPSEHDRFPTGLMRPIRLKKGPKKAENPQQKSRRQLKAALKTSDLADFLASKEMYRRWIEIPYAERRLVDRRGIETRIRTNPADIKQKLESFKLPHAGATTDPDPDPSTQDGGDGGGSIVKLQSKRKCSQSSLSRSSSSSSSIVPLPAIVLG